MNVENELGVIVKFAQISENYGFRIISIQSNFPDAIIEKDGIEYRAEFEFVSSNFNNHKHDVRKCDLIICWQNDLTDSILPILELSINNWQFTDLTLPDEKDRLIDYWKRRALLAEKIEKRNILLNSDISFSSGINSKELEVYQIIEELRKQGKKATVTNIARSVNCAPSTASKWLGIYNDRNNNHQ